MMASTADTKTATLDSLDKEQMKTVRVAREAKAVKDIMNRISLFTNFMLHLQFTDFLMSYNKLSEMCFTDCVRDFTSRTVKDTEVCWHLHKAI